MLLASPNPKSVALHFALRQTVFSLDGILRQVHQMTLNPRRSHTPHFYMLLLSSVPKFLSVLLCVQPFLNYRPLPPNYHKMTLSTTRSIHPYVCVTMIHKYKISLPFVLLRSPVIHMQALNTTGPKMLHICVTIYINCDWELIRLGVDLLFYFLVF